MIKLGCLLAFVIIIGIPFVAAQFLPWWGTLLVIVAEGVVLVFGVPLLIKMFALGFAKRMFTTKSRVLRGATVEVHACTIVPEPTQADPEDPELEAELLEDLAETRARIARYIQVDATISPVTKQSGPMIHWDPYDFQLCPFHKELGFDEELGYDDDSCGDSDEGHLESVRLIDELGAEQEDFDKLNGPARLRIVFACPHSLVGRVKLRYYFESLGDFMLPPLSTES